MKNTVKLTESKLKRIISESIESILQEFMAKKELNEMVTPEYYEHLLKQLKQNKKVVMPQKFVEGFRKYCERYNIFPEGAGVQKYGGEEIRTLYI